MKLMAILAITGGCLAAIGAAGGHASAQPSCDDAQCVPYVAHGVAQGVPCVLRTRYAFGLDSSGGTLICSANGHWVQSPPLVGVRNLGDPCFGSNGSAQSPDGVPLGCLGGGGWSADYSGIYYSGTV
jgi:hypothetical protein